jgi:hypothetical protein
VLNFQTNAVVLGGEEDRLWHYAERLAASSSLSQGIVPDKVGPTRSTSGVVSLLNQMDKEFRPVVDCCAEQWVKMTKMILDDLDWRIDSQVKMKVLGASVEDFIDPNKDRGMQEGIMSRILRINGQLDVEINVAEVIRSDDVLRSEATTILQMLTTPSVAHQIGVLGPKALFKAYSDWLKSFGRDPDKYLDQPLIQKPLTLYQEIQICYQDQMPPMAMQDEHDQKAQFLMSWIKSPEYQIARAKGLASINSETWLAKAAQKHMAIFQAMQPKGLPNAGGDQGTDYNEMMSGTADQQGGQDPNKTTGRADGGKGERTRRSAGPAEGAGVQPPVSEA